MKIYALWYEQLLGLGAVLQRVEREAIELEAARE